MGKSNIYITDQEFSKLTLIERYGVVADKGYHIAKRLNSGMEVYLYRVDDFYVEVWKHYTIGEINAIEIAPENSIEKYAESVDLKRLLNN